MTRLSIGFCILYGLLQGAASVLGSTRGESGGMVALLVVGAGLLIGSLLHKQGWKELGLGTPARRGLRTALLLAAVLLAGGTIYAMVAGGGAEVASATPWLLFGLFAQAGIAEEVVFRGYLFGQLRRTSPFWRAALMSVIPFALVHLVLFLSLPWTVALTAIVMSVAMTFPLSWLYELGGRTIWAPAVLHTLLQAVPKLMLTPGDAAFQIAWMLGGMIVAWSAFMVRPEHAADPGIQQRGPSVAAAASIATDAASR